MIQQDEGIGEVTCDPASLIDLFRVDLKVEAEIMAPEQGESPTPGWVIHQVGPRRNPECRVSMPVQNLSNAAQIRT